MLPSEWGYIYGSGWLLDTFLQPRQLYGLVIWKMLAQLPQSVLSSLDYLQPQPEEHMFILVDLQDRVIFFMSFEWCALGKSKLFSCSPFGKGRKGRKRLRYLISLPSPPSSPSSIACKCYTIKLTIFLISFLSPL